MKGNIMRYHFMGFSFIIPMLFLWGCASHKPAVNLQQPALDKAQRIDRVIIAGQPTEQEIRSLKSRGILHVFNLRSLEEMKSLNFDEPALLKELGIEYVNVPVSGDLYPYRTEVLDAFASLMEANKDTVLLHCRSGGRARWLYAAYEIKYLKRTPDDVIRSLESIKAWPLPVEQLTGIPLKIEMK
jgi:protein tyrosine phosphatase (PTP) superfamily phosphohydrolase (DUF442 family)